MNLTKRDRKLLTGLGIFIVVVVFVKFLFLPKIASISTLKSEIATLNNTYTMNLTYKAKNANMDSDIKILSEKLKTLRATYPPSINTDELLILLRDIIKDSKIKVASLTFDKPTALALQAEPTAANADASQSASNNAPQLPDVNNLTNTNIMNYFYLWGLQGQMNSYFSNADITVPDGKSYSVSVKLDASGTNTEIKEFLSALSKLNNRAYCKKINISADVNSEQEEDSDTKLKVTAEIEFLGIMDKGAGEYYLLKNGKWSPMNSTNKTDIFKPYEGYNADFEDIDMSSQEASTAGKTDEAANLNDYDFSVVAAPYGGGLAPSVSISCYKPESSLIYTSPVVYGDNKEYENAELFIEQKEDGRYYCKFKTDHDAYPDKQYSQTFPFIPSGKDLKVLIYAILRKSDNDKAGINLTIINNSDKTLYYEIKNDDSSKPRVKIVKTTGSVKNAK